MGPLPGGAVASRQRVRSRIQSFHVLALIAVTLSFPVCGCADHLEEFEDPPINLVPNGSFERDGRGTLDGWQVTNPSLASLVREAAPGGGEWSLRLEADGAPTTGRVRFPVPGLRDGDTVRLSAHVRAPTANGGGSVGVEVTAGDGRLRHESFTSSENTQWTRVSLTERLSVNAGDVVWVVLRSPPTEIEARAGLFDLVTLERVASAR
jgi:hypothetical protein